MATQQEILAWLAANPQATDRDIAAAMNQYGVNTQDLAAATGWDSGAVNDRYAVANAQNYIDSQLSSDLPWWGAAYKPDGTFDYSNNQRNNIALGALAGMGLTPDQQAQVLGLPSDAIQAYAQQNAPSVDIYKSIYQKDATDPAPYMQPVNSTVNPASTLGITQSAVPTAAQPQTQGITDAQIAQWLASNPGASDQQIRSAMNQYGVGVGQMARATGMDYGDVMSRYSAAAPTAQNAPSAIPPAGSGTWSDNFGGGAPGGQGMFGQMYGGYQASPWLSSVADEIGRRTQQGLGQAFNSIRSNAVGNGTLGGSRQGVAEGIATRGAMDSLQGQLAGLYGQDWTNAQNRGLTARGQDMGFYTQQRGQDLAQIGLGADIYDRGVRGGWAPIQNANNVFGNYTGFGNSTSTSQQGGGWQGAVGGALGAGQYAKNMGWW